MTVDEQIRELRAELSWNDDPAERRQIAQELKACLERSNRPNEEARTAVCERAG